jgi:cysteine desulfurase/selenocysteine lyase
MHDHSDNRASRTTGAGSANSLAAPALPLDVGRLRDDFPILSTLIHGDKPLVYLDNAATTQRPRAVVQAIVDCYEGTYSNVHRGIHWLSDQSTDMYEQAREKTQQFINAPQPHEIVFTSGCTSAINLVARSWGDAHVGEGDEILVSVMDHHSNLVPWFQLAERTGCTVKAIPVTDDGLLVLDELDRLLTDRTKLVALCAVSNVLGTINPIKEVTRRVHEAGARMLVDAAQGVPHGPTDVQDWGADFVAFSGHKMLGPTGIGVLWGREDLLEPMPAFLGGGSMIRRVRIDGFEPGMLPQRFEAGTPPIAQAIGLAAAIDYLQTVGMDNIREYEQILTHRAHEVLRAEGGVRFLGPSVGKKAGIVSFTVKDVHAADTAQVMDRYGIAVRAGHHCTEPLHSRLGISSSCRASFYFYNTLEEIDRLGEALANVKRVLKRR